MRHQTFGKKLNRDIKERKALFKSLILALIAYGKIKTTLGKAKAIQRLVDKLVTRAKDGSDSAFRQISAFLARKEAINKLTKEIAPRFKKTAGGYLHVRRIGERVGDAAEEVILEWSVAAEKKVEPVSVKPEEKKLAEKKSSEKPTKKKITKKNKK